jgi:phospholipid transport system substrate-binding protein
MTTVPNLNVLILRSLMSWGILGTIAISMTQPAIAAAESSSIQLVDKLGREAITTLTDPNAPQADIEARFLTLLTRDFDVSKISQFVLGRYWKTADQQQRDTFSKLFIHRLKKAYANRFKEFRGVNFQVKGSREQSGYDVVNSFIKKPDGPEIHVDWWIKGGKIQDVVVDGISMRTTLRDDYYALVDSHSGNVANFIKDLEKRS